MNKIVQIGVMIINGHHVPMGWPLLAKRENAGNGNDGFFLCEHDPDTFENCRYSGLFENWLFISYIIEGAVIFVCLSPTLLSLYTR